MLSRGNEVTCNSNGIDTCSDVTDNRLNAAKLKAEPLTFSNGPLYPFAVRYRQIAISE